MRVRVFFFEPSLVYVGVGVRNTVVAVLVLVLGVLVLMRGVGMLVRGVLVPVRVDINPMAVVLGHLAPFVDDCYMPGICTNSIYPNTTA